MFTNAVGYVGTCGLGSFFGHAPAEHGREASWYAFQREALERGGRGGEGMAEIETRPGLCKVPSVVKGPCEISRKQVGRPLGESTDPKGRP